MNSHDVFCPSPDCPTRGRSNAGNIWIHSRTPPRSRCTDSQKTFGARVGTPVYRCSTAEAISTLVVTLLAHGCPIAAIIAAFRFQRQTVAAWMDAAGVQSGAVHQPLVCQGRVVWLALSLQSATWRWLGGVISPGRDRMLIARLCMRVRACALPERLLVCVDGVAA